MGRVWWGHGHHLDPARLDPARLDPARLDPPGGARHREPPVRLGTGVEAAVHVCTLLAFVPPDTPGLPSSALAEYHGLEPTYLAKTLQALVRAGICRSTPGRRGGFHLARPTDEITLADVTAAVEGTAPAFRCAEIRQRGPAAVDDPAAYAAPCVIAAAFARAEDAWWASLAGVTVADLVEGLVDTGDPRQLEAGAAWLAVRTGTAPPSPRQHPRNPQEDLS